jgi:hypothetical protein
LSRSRHHWRSTGVQGPVTRRHNAPQDDRRDSFVLKGGCGLKTRSESGATSSRPSIRAVHAGEFEIAVVDLRGIMLLRRQLGQVRHGVDMNGLRYHFRLIWIALAAILGMSSVVGNASASTTAGVPKNGSLACCLKRVCTVCCCTPAPASDPSKTERSMALPSSESGLYSSARPCECRSGGPGSPASRHESRSSEDRHDETQGEPVDLSVHVPTAVPFARLMVPTANPPKSPLYLRTARLLI